VRGGTLSPLRQARHPQAHRLLQSQQRPDGGSQAWPRDRLPAEPARGATVVEQQEVRLLRLHEQMPGLPEQRWLR
jgi:hypothetical protein